MTDYAATRDRVEGYFDRTATRVWERLTSDAPVSGVRATVRAGRDRMRSLMLAQLPEDLRGSRVLDAGCGTGAAAVELARRGADVLAVDLSPQLIEIARQRCPIEVSPYVDWQAGDMLEVAQGQFDHVVAMDSLIYYDTTDVARVLAALARRVDGKIAFTLPPRTPLLMAMYRVGKLFPRSDRSPQMVPQSAQHLSRALGDASGQLCEIERVTSGFYISTLFTYRGGRG